MHYVEREYTFSMFATYTQKSHPPIYTAHLSSSSQPSPQVKMKFRQLPEVHCLFVLCNIKVITFKEFLMFISIDILLECKVAFQFWL